MGCFLACFGFKKKKNYRKLGKKRPSGEQNHGSYVPLDSDVSIKLDANEKDVTSDSYQLIEKPKEPTLSKIKKKVSFNLNVKAYEPIPHDDDDTGMYLSEGKEETKWEFTTETKSTASLHNEEDTIASSIRSHPGCYRYQNCRESYEDEDDELKLEENDLNFDDFEDSDEEDDDVCSNESDDGMLSREDYLPWESNPVTVKLDNEVTNNEIPDGKNRSLDDLLDLQSNARDRSQYVFSVLNPIENLTQWKVVKAREATDQLRWQKENFMFMQERNSLSRNNKHHSDSLDFKKMRNPNVFQSPGHNIAVDSSLSNWLG